jgi:hypothetical protein
VSSLQRTYENQRRPDHADEERTIPWAQGNGLWHAVSQIISDLPGVDLVTFFVQNPYTCDSAESIAVRIGYRVEQVEPTLQALSDAGLLKRTPVDDLHLYELTDDLRKRQTLQQYVSWLQEGYHWARMAMDLPRLPACRNSTKTG